MEDQYILDKGYHKYKRTFLESESIMYNFQKCFSDNIGKRYFINVHKWDRTFIPEQSRDEYWVPYVYEYSVQMYGKGHHEAIDMGFHCGWALDDVESFMEEQWNTGLYDYYEKFFDSGE